MKTIYVRTSTSIISVFITGFLINLIIFLMIIFELEKEIANKNVVIENQCSTIDSLRMKLPKDTSWIITGSGRIGSPVNPDGMSSAVLHVYQGNPPCSKLILPDSLTKSKPKIRHYRKRLVVDTLSISTTKNVGGNINPSCTLHVSNGDSGLAEVLRVNHRDSIPYAKSAPEWKPSPYYYSSGKLGVGTIPTNNLKYTVEISSQGNILDSMFIDYHGIIPGIGDGIDSAGNRTIYFYKNNNH